MLVAALMIFVMTIRAVVDFDGRSDLGDFFDFRKAPYVCPLSSDFPLGLVTLGESGFAEECPTAAMTEHCVMGARAIVSFVLVI